MNQKVQKDRNKSQNIDTTDSSCFIIMPIADTDGYPTEHFRHVYENIISPACKNVELTPIRADDVKSTNLIHLDIIKRLIETPIAICDLSSRNPNVLFELGIRQAFDRPVVLIQEENTPAIFDIGPLRYLEYSKEMRYHDVLKTQKELTEAIRDTMSNTGANGHINSIVKLLALSDSAQIPELQGDRESVSIDVMRSELHQMRRLMEDLVKMSSIGNSQDKLLSVEYEKISALIDRSENDTKAPLSDRISTIKSVLPMIDKFSSVAVSREEFEAFSILRKRGERVLRSLRIEEEKTY